MILLQDKEHDGGNGNEQCEETLGICIDYLNEPRGLSRCLCVPSAAQGRDKHKELRRLVVRLGPARSPAAPPCHPHGTQPASLPQAETGHGHHCTCTGPFVLLLLLLTSALLILPACLLTAPARCLLRPLSPSRSLCPVSPQQSRSVLATREPAVPPTSFQN